MNEVHANSATAAHGTAYFKANLLTALTALRRVANASPREHCYDGVRGER